jgi:hypothetical protein
MAPATKRGLLGSIAVYFVACLLGQPCRGEVHLARQVAALVLGLRDAGGAEGVGLHDVGAGLQVLLVDGADGLGAREREQFVVALEQDLVVLHAFRMEVLLGEAELLDHGAHGTVEDEDALLGELFECLHRTVVHQRSQKRKSPTRWTG